MNNTILQPTSNRDAKKHYDDTITNPVKINKIKKYLSNIRYDELKKIYTDNKVYVWGIKPGKKGVNIDKWKRIKRGDITLFYANKKFFASAITTYTLHNKSLAEYLWGKDSEGQTWEYIYFVDDLKACDISLKQFNIVARYKPKNIIRGFSVISGEKSDNIITYYNIENDTYGEQIPQEDYEDEVKKLMRSDNLDARRNGTSRKEQSFLRKSLFGGKRVDKCGICGRELPIDLLVTAHIKKRSKCTLEERLDYRNIVMPMCKFGCDDLYEKGYIYVENGEIKINNNKKITEDMKEKLNYIEGKQCSVWNENNNKYFESHSRSHGIQ